MRYALICLLTLGIPSYVFAQDVVFKTIINPKKVGIEDHFEIRYVLENAGDIKSLDPPKSLTSNFLILGGPMQGRSSSSITTNRGTRRTSSFQVTYIIKAKKEGVYNLSGAVAEDIDGNIYKSNSVKITVVGGSLDPRNRQQNQYQQPREKENPENRQTNLDKDILLKVEVDKNNVFQGEQITATYKLFYRVPIFQCVISKDPSLDGFWMQDFVINRNPFEEPVIEKVDNIPYYVTTLKKTGLFPQQIGQLELDPAEISAYARTVSGDIPFSLKSEPQYITVKGLPDSSKASNFTGAVGIFSITSSIDKVNATTDDVITLTLDIKGKGNIKLINAPILDLPDGLVYYAPQMVDDISETDGVIFGSKKITYTITPQVVGNYDIDSIPFTYFNPNTEEYTTIKTKPISLNIAAGSANHNTDDALQKVITDIHTIHTDNLNSNISLFNKPILYTAGYWSMYAISLFALFGILFWQKNKSTNAIKNNASRNNNSNSVALKRLKGAQSLLQKNDSESFYNEVSKAVWLYLSNKLHIPISNLSKENVYTALNKYNISQEQQIVLNELITTCEASLYAGNKGEEHMATTYSKAIAIISNLEKSFKA